ncbi:MAG: AAA family ATPase [Thiomargarita sp.]|nr:AAA family ATPase [Thiomargarita sp.]
MKNNNQVKISKIKLSNYKFFYGSFELPVNGKNLLVYGENGSGKSAIYKAIELLTKDNFTDLDKSLNIFADNEKVEIEFEFTNKPSLVITSDVKQKPKGYEFLNGLSIFSPLLDYKKLLKVHYSSNINGNNVNLYSMFRQLLKNYPINENQKLGDIAKNLTRYLDELKRVLENDFMNEVNNFLKKYFNSDVGITSFETTIELEEDSQKGIPCVFMNVDYKENEIEKYHTFLNEARLSALAISIYFVAIKKLLGTLQEESLKILVIDDLLISLDMNNRIKLFEILKNEFNDFQILFFTHEKELFELYKNKMDWEKYELYLDDNAYIPNVILKKGQSEIERAKVYYAKKEYDICAVLLRKSFENILKEYLTNKEQRDKNCNVLNLAGLVGKAISKSTGNNKVLLTKLNFDRKHILNPLSHDDERAIYSEELKSALLDLEKLKSLLPSKNNS